MVNLLLLLPTFPKTCLCLCHHVQINGSFWPIGIVYTHTVTHLGDEHNIFQTASRSRVLLSTDKPRHEGVECCLIQFPFQQTKHLVKLHLVFWFSCLDMTSPCPTQCLKTRGIIRFYLCTCHEHNKCFMLGPNTR